MITLFWLALLFVAYTYAGYPLLVWWLSRLRAPLQVIAPQHWPAVSVVVPFCNEPTRVAAKLATLHAQDYPGEMQVIFVSDGEEDETAAEVRACAAANVSALVLPARAGKPSALNAALPLIRHELVLFSDARQQLATDALRRLVTRIQHPDVAAVSGELVLVDDRDRARIGLYWRYEKWIRQAESRLASVPGVTGALYLIRRQYVRPLSADTLLDDFDMPLPALREGKRVLFEAGAQVFDRVAEDMAREKARKVRTLTGNFQSFLRHPWLFSPRANPIWWQFMSHKVARLLVPYALLLLLVLPLLVATPFYLAVFAAQLVFYGLAFGNVHHWPLCGNPLAALARLFTELNLAALQAAWQYWRGSVDARWERTA